MIRNQYILDIHSELIVDNFAGGGGASCAIEMALGRHVNVAVNHDPQAISMHEVNHPQTQHYCENVWDVDPLRATEGRPVGLAWFSPDCFPSGTLVMTDKGYRPIEQIRIGDRVLTHKLRWRAVTECSSAVRPLIEIRGLGHPGLRVSPEHPFYTREQFRVRNNDQSSYDHCLHPATWTPASKVDKNVYWATPRTFPASAVPRVAGCDIDITDEFLWLAGRYLADGWTQMTDTRTDLIIPCDMHEVDSLRHLLKCWPLAGDRSISSEQAWRERATHTAYEFTANHRGLVEWFREHFGHRAQAKGVPAWALGLPAKSREALLEGYLSAGVHKFEYFLEAHTISKSLAFGVKALANSLGKTVAVYSRPHSSVNERGDVKALTMFKVRWRHDVHAEHKQTYIEEGIEWCPVREQSHVAESEEVFNIGVDEDESYVVEGIVVHNCKHFSKAKGGKPRDKNIRSLAWVVHRWASLVKPRVIILENVEEFQAWGPLLESGQPCPARKGYEFRSFVRQLENKGYVVEYQELRACDYGAPTLRKRLFLIARCDGLPIVWPKPTHGDPGATAGTIKKLKPWRSAAECIDWSVHCPSIFTPGRNLCENTMRRIAKGLRRYIIDCDDPFVVPENNIYPFLTEHANGSTQRVFAAQEPLRTQCAQVKGGHFALVSAFLAKHFGGVTGADIRIPMPTITARGTQTQLVAAYISKMRGTNIGSRADHPLHTISAGGQHHAAVMAFLIKYFGTDQDPRLEDPMHTVTTRDRFGIVTIRGEDYQIVDIGMRMLTPRELYRAQGFPESYIIDRTIHGNALTKTAQVRMCGNSVSPPPAISLVRANVPEIIAFAEQEFKSTGTSHPR